jgi:mannan endo-1,4-beta-mannosidase
VFFRIALSIVITLLVTNRASAVQTTAADTTSGFVTVNEDVFLVDDHAYHFAGTNCYYLMVWAAEPSLRPDVDEVLEEAALMGMTVIRTWAFNDGDGWNALQTAPGVYNETVFQGLDYVLDRCRTLGLRVVLPLVNNWVDYGGMDQYVAWSPTAQFHDDFYTDDSTRTWYRNHARRIVQRVNTFNGMTYRDDPTILAWELANESRCPSDTQGNALVAWITEMSAYLKSIDPNHLVTTGIEGFFDDGSGPWYLNGSQGVDFVRDHQVISIDYATAHSWPDHWGFDLEATMDLLSRQLTEASGVIGKPFVLEEYGKLRDGAARQARNHYDPATYFSPGTAPTVVPGAVPLGTPSWNSTVDASGWQAGTTERDLFFQTYHDRLLARRAGGSNYWIAYHDSYSDYDGFGVYYPQDTSTIAILEAHAVAMSQLSLGVGEGNLTLTPRLGTPFPNPFSSRVQCWVEGLVLGIPLKATVFDLRGRRMATIHDTAPLEKDPLVSWDGLVQGGKSAAPGVYYLRLEQGGWSGATRVVLLP